MPLKTTEVCARPRDIGNYTIMEMSPLKGGNMWKLTGVSVDLLEGRLFYWEERVGRSEIWRMNFTSKLAEDFHVPLFFV